jgi:hypothetical protein
MDQDIEYCGSGWRSVLDGSAECESGHCCSIHGICGLEEYHCWFGMPAEWILFNGILLMCVWAFVYSVGANRRIISLMEDYKRKGERIDALVVPITKRTWAGCYQQLLEGIGHRRWNQISLEYNVKTLNKTSNNTNNNNNKEVSRRVRKTVSVSRTVMTSVSSERTIRVLVLPDRPMSAFARDDVDSTILRQQKGILETSFFIFISLGIYVYMSLLLLSLISGKENKDLGWIYFWTNFLWSPFLPYILSRRRERSEHKMWATDGEFVNDSDAVALLGQATA